MTPIAVPETQVQTANNGNPWRIPRSEILNQTDA